MGENFLFSAHMIQHNILMYTCPLFFLLSLPEQLVDQIFEKNPILEKSAKFLFHPIIAGLLFTLIFSFWHIGAFYEAAIRDKTIHMAEHLSMYLSSIAMWWPVCGPSKRVPSLTFRTSNALHPGFDVGSDSHLCLPYLFRGCFIRHLFLCGENH
jgi:putative membrane protein